MKYAGSGTTCPRRRKRHYIHPLCELGYLKHEDVAMHVSGIDRPFRFQLPPHPGFCKKVSLARPMSCWTRETFPK